jgi:hypothetical protein
MYSKYIMKRKRKVDNGPATGSDEDPGELFAPLDIQVRAQLWNLTTPVIFSVCVWCCPNWVLLQQLLSMCSIVKYLMNIDNN